jgi:hypothetical protein
MAAAAGGVGALEPVVPIHEKVLYWYIAHHQEIISDMLLNISKKVRYYGGFALNVALGCHSLPATPSLLTCYTNGVDILTEYARSEGGANGAKIDMHASDIDAKILGVSDAEEYAILSSMIINGIASMVNIAHIPSTEPEFLTEVWKATIPKGTTQVLPFPVFIRTPDDLEDSPIEYILAHIISYMKADGPHYQLILTGFFKDGATWKSQVLSELTPSSEAAPHSADTFLYTPLSELHGQFQALSRYLEGRRNAYSVARKRKTNIRIAVSHRASTKPSSKEEKRGGGRRLTRRRRGSVKK